MLRRRRYQHGRSQANQRADQQRVANDDAPSGPAAFANRERDPAEGLKGKAQPTKADIVIHASRPSLNVGSARSPDRGIARACSERLDSIAGLASSASPCPFRRGTIHGPGESTLSQRLRSQSGVRESATPWLHIVGQKQFATTRRSSQSQTPTGLTEFWLKREPGRGRRHDCNNYKICLASTYRTPLGAEVSPVQNPFGAVDQVVRQKGGVDAASEV